MYILRVATVYDPEIESLPAEFRNVLTEKDVEAIHAGPEYFAKIAGADAPKWLSDVLVECANTGFELQFHSLGDIPYRPYFRFFWQGQPAVSLPRGEPLRSDMPEFLRRVYNVIGAFRENEFDTAGGLFPAEELVPFSEAGIAVNEEGDVSAARAVPFLEDLDGSMLCYLPDGSGAWFDSGTLRRVEDLEKEIAKYFEAVLSGMRPS